MIPATNLDYCLYLTADKKYFFFTSNQHLLKAKYTSTASAAALPLNVMIIFIG